MWEMPALKDTAETPPEPFHSGPRNRRRGYGHRPGSDDELNGDEVDIDPCRMLNADLQPRVILTADSCIETARLIVRGFTLDDLDQIAEVFGDPQVMWTKPGTMTPEQTRTWLEGALQRYDSDGMSECAVVLRSTDRVIGDCGLVMREIESERLPEFNWDLRSDMWGNGYATEAARGVLTHSAGLGLRRICALIKKQNERSKRVAARLGMRFERRVEWEGGPWDLWVIELP
jgi:[ribosomal protein S5]-alanine N-acetyltransferase